LFKEDVKSLSLPGTYQVKIQSIGDALRRFTRIKELDLSKNQLISLEGLESLKYLEKLNLYYNNISNIAEIERLRANKSLIEIDLRLNPITKEDIDYRLYLIQLLPNIEKIDDRHVKDSERQMAVMYFENKNIDSRKAGFELFQNDQMNQVPSNRVKTVTNLVKRSAGINDENDNVYFKSSYQSSSSATASKAPNYEQYSQNDLKLIGEKENRLYERRNSLNNRFKSSSLQDLSSLDMNTGKQCEHLQSKTLYKTLISIQIEYKTRCSKNVKFHDKITYFDFEGSYSCFVIYSF
jgi:centrosomal protein CEP72